MGEKSPVREVGGVSVGDKGDPYKPVQEELERRGVPVVSGTVHHWRTGDRQAGKSIRRLRIPEIISEEGSARKNAQFLRIIKTAVEEKEMRRNDPAAVPNRRYGLVDSVAEKLRVPPGEINVTFRLMRADICLAQGVPSAVADSFAQAVEEFRSEHPLDSNRESPLTRKIYEGKWNGDLKGFYEILGTVGSPTVKAWIPHELEMFHVWYLHQQEESNSLTAFDRMVLENWRRYNLQPTSKEIKILTGVSLDPSALAVHVRALEGKLLPKIA